MLQKQTLNIDFSKLFFGFFGAILVLTTVSNPVLAQTVSDIGENMIDNTAELPGLITGIAYLIGVVFAVRAIFNFKAAVDSPGGGITIRHGAISLAIGGAMFALPIVYESMSHLIQPDDGVTFEPDKGFIETISGGAGAVFGALPVGAFGNILSNIIDSVEEVPGLITGVAYLLGTYPWCRRSFENKRSC